MGHAGRWMRTTLGRIAARASQPLAAALSLSWLVTADSGLCATRPTSARTQTRCNGLISAMGHSMIDAAVPGQRPSLRLQRLLQ